MAEEPWKLEPHCVFGGYEIRWARWVYARNGWDLETEPYDGDATVYPTRAAAEARILQIRGEAA